MPIDTSMTSGSVGTRKLGLKYGGPTESVPRWSVSAIRGARVPPKTTAAATTSRMLLNSRKDSRDTIAKPAEEPSFGARQANRVSAPPIIRARKLRMKIPRAGSEAKECTDTSTPERTSKGPRRLREQTATDRGGVQLVNRPRLSVTASE